MKSCLFSSLVNHDYCKADMHCPCPNYLERTILGQLPPQLMLENITLTLETVSDEQLAALSPVARQIAINFFHDQIQRFQQL